MYLILQSYVNVPFSLTFKSAVKAQQLQITQNMNLDTEF